MANIGYLPSIPVVSGLLTLVLIDNFNYEMAELRDIHGNPVQLTDAHGNPVKLTDEYGNPVHVSGVATTVPPGGAANTTVFGTEKATHCGNTVADMIASEPRTTDRPVAVDQPKLNEREPRELHRSSSSSSSSSEDDGQGGRRKKNRGLKDKIKEKLPGGKHKNREENPHSTTATTTTTATGGHHATTTTTHPEHEKKSIMEKIKEKLPGHHTH